MSIYPKRKDSSFMPLRRTSCHSEAALLNFKQLYVEKRGNHESGLLWSCFSLVIVLSSAYDIVPESELVQCSTNEGSVHRPHSIHSSKSFSQGKIPTPPHGNWQFLKSGYYIEHTTFVNLLHFTWTREASLVILPSLGEGWSTGLHREILWVSLRIICPKDNGYKTAQTGCCCTYGLIIHHKWQGGGRKGHYLFQGLILLLQTNKRFIFPCFSFFLPSFLPFLLLV